MNIRHAFYITTVVTALGCSRTAIQEGPVVTPRPISALDSTTRIDSTDHRGSLLRLFHAGDAEYDYRTLSIVRVTMGDTIPRIDTTTVSAIVSATFWPVGTDNLTINASVTADSIAVRTGLGTPTRFASYVDTLRINTTTGQVVLPNSRQNQCDVETREALVRIDDLVPTLLSTRTGTWSDTSVRHICRAGIQLQARRVTTYRLDSTTTELRLVRTGLTSFNGRGVQWNQAVESAGQSISTDTLFLDLTSRQRIQQVRGVTQLQLSFRSQLRNQQFEQSTQLLIQLR